MNTRKSPEANAVNVTHAPAAEMAFRAMGYDARHVAMKRHRLGSYVLLAGGCLLVFAGLASALGCSASGVGASGAAIIALLYAGGVWFGPSPSADVSVVLYTPQLT